MKRWAGPLIFGIVCAGAAHGAVLQFAPSMIMDVAMEKIADRGAQLHRFQVGPRTTPETQTVVRPSPDLAYSACLFDLSQAPEGLRVSLAATPGYASLSFFDARTNNFLTIRGGGTDREIILLSPNEGRGEPGTAVAPTMTGVILTRRLAPTQADFDQMSRIAALDRCDAI
ncbi:hypothetical protein MACH24_17420 [Erythrobacter sp. Dej080120_24]|uniref:DUF1254 domain-containing protein n=1 Tax=Erythrobacter sp. Dej080120_24 TaxID=3024837 RepID=UPI00291FEA56|nr:hypothetical protein MACH24_17420 [Erythrobacter sp. Dej080120_24]